MAWIKGFAWFCVFVLLAGMGLAWWFFPDLIIMRFPELAHMEPPQKSAFSDMYGILSAFFSGFALVGVIFSVFMQRKEFSAQLKEMQEQTELQTLPFLVVKKGPHVTGGGSIYSVFNIGNSTAINVLIYDITVKNFIRPTYSVIAQSGEIGLELAMNRGKQKDLIISFENINGKPYYIEESVKDDTYKIEKFEPCKYEFPISID